MSRWLSQVSRLRQRQSVHIPLMSPSLRSCCPSCTSSCWMVRRGRDLHLHGQVFVPPEGPLASVAAASSRAIVHQQYEGADHETSCGIQIHDPHVACWCHVLCHPCILLVKHDCSSLPALAPLPHLHVFTFSFVPSQLVRTDPYCDPQHDTSLRFVAKELGSVKHEDPTTSKQQIGVICQTLNIEAFTSFCQAYDRAMCSDFPWHNCLLPPHGVEDCTVVFSPLSCVLGHIRDFLLDISRLLGTRRRKP